MHYPAGYPVSPRDRDRFVLTRRPARPIHDPWQHQGLIVEGEPTGDGRTARVGTVLLTGRECPWRCVMCDLWRGTTTDTTPRGAIPAQVAAARRQLLERGEHVTAMKLYNAGSFFDPRAVPEEDYDDIARQLGGIERVVSSLIRRWSRAASIRGLRRSNNRPFRRSDSRGSKSRWASRPSIPMRSTS